MLSHLESLWKEKDENQDRIIPGVVEMTDDMIDIQLVIRDTDCPAFPKTRNRNQKNIEIAAKLEIRKDRISRNEQNANSFFFPAPLVHHHYST